MISETRLPGPVLETVPTAIKAGHPNLVVTAPVPLNRARPAYHPHFLIAQVARWRPLILAAGSLSD